MFAVGAWSFPLCLQRSRILMKRKEPLILFASLVLLYVAVLFEQEVNGIVAVVLVGACGLSALAAFIMVGMQSQRSKTQKIGLLGLALLLGAGWFVSLGTLTDWSEQLYYLRRADKLNRFVEQITQDDKLYHLNDGRGRYTLLNEYLIASSSGELASSGIGRPVLLLEDALMQAKVSQSTFDSFQQQLIELGITEFTESDHHISFLSKGFLDNTAGLLYQKGDEIPRLHDQLWRGEIIYLQQLNDRWYFYRTT